MAKKRKPFFKLKKVNFHILSIGILLLLLGAIIVLRGVYSYQAQKALAEGFVDAVEFKSNTSKNNDSKEPVRIIIPGISIDLPVKSARIIAGYWEVFNDSAAWGEESGYPGKPGNQVIFAHAKKGLFLLLRNIAVGDNVYVMTDAAWYTYEVKEIKYVYPNQKEVIAPTIDETLTLYTCTGYEDTERLIVVAKRI